MIFFKKVYIIYEKFDFNKTFDSFNIFLYKMFRIISENFAKLQIHKLQKITNSEIFEKFYIFIEIC